MSTITMKITLSSFCLLIFSISAQAMKRKAEGNNDERPAKILKTESSQSAHFPGLFADTTELLVHYMPLKTQLCISMTSKGFFDLVNNKQRRVHENFSNANTKEQLDRFVHQEPQGSILRSLILKEDLSETNRDLIFDNLLKFGLFLKKIDIEVPMTDEQLGLLNKLTNLKDVTIRKGKYTEESLIALASLKNLKSLYFSAPCVFPQSAFIKLLKNKQLKSLYIFNPSLPAELADFELPNLGSLTLRNGLSPISLLVDAYKRTPGLRELNLRYPSNIALTGKDVSSLLALNLEKLNFRGDHIPIGNNDLLALVNHFSSGSVICTLKPNYFCFDGIKTLPKNTESIINFYIDNIELYTEVLSKTMAYPTQEWTLSSNRDDPFVNDMYEELLLTVKTDSQLKLALYGSKNLEISRYTRYSKRFSDKPTIELFGSIQFKDELLKFWPRKDSLLTIYFDMHDSGEDLHFLERDGVHKLVYDYDKDLYLTKENFKKLTKGCTLAELRLHGKTLKISSELWQYMAKSYRITYTITGKYHSLLIKLIDNKKDTHGVKPIQIITFEISINEALKYFPADVNFEVYIRMAGASFDFASLLRLSNLCTFSFGQEQDAIVITDDLARALNDTENKKLRYFHLRAPKVSHKSKLHAKWSVSDSHRGDMKGYNFNLKTHDESHENREPIKEIDFHAGELPLPEK